MPKIALRKTATCQCSFCGKPDNEVAKLVAGPGVYICDECVALCQLIITQSNTAPQPDAVRRLRAWELADDADAVLESLPRVARAADQVEKDLAGWVGRARELGATWARIGEALGMTRQSAWARFSGEE
jgi:hypothetical protein